MQLAFGYAATGTTFRILPWVLMGVCACLFAADAVTVRTLRKPV